MTQPLALVFYEKLLPGSQVVNRLQDLNYRVLTAPDAGAITACAEQEKPMVVIVDLSAAQGKVIEAIQQLRKNPATNHLPLIAYADEKDEALQKSATDAGASVVVSDAAISTHLEQFLERALHLE